ncbi:hypothetical protein HanXRQr2_Chr02g0058651 [Helianthus annuus]|uniref:Uncharacterized protein n=1 Tax=Helianthus annuus TaxID=4232 RepID=A0A9K3JMF0_HELAN|nr:hypothetical protein HanXRQr2_Chr02g0058651 [Helianthus annuus]
MLCLIKHTLSDPLPIIWKICLDRVIITARHYCTIVEDYTHDLDITALLAHHI